MDYTLIADIVIGVLALLFVVNGYNQGFVKAAGNLIGLVVSIFAGVWGVQFIEDLTGFNLTGHTATFILTFLLIAVIVSQLIRLLVSALDLIRRLMSIIPFLGLINRLLGLALGAVQAAVFITGVAYVAVKFIPSSPWQAALLGSWLVGKGVFVAQQLGVL
jgi:membrane protein required for colicin V production